MNKNLFTLSIVCLISIMIPLQAFEINEMTADFRASAFFPTSKRFANIYGNVGPNYAIEFSIPVGCSFDSWINIDWFHKHDRLKSYSRTTIDIFNVSFGAKYLYPICDNWNVYLGAGICLGRVFLKNRFYECREHLSRYAVGGVIKSRINYTFCNGIFVEAFIDYLYESAKFQRTANISGFKTGLGIGYSF